MSIGAFLVQEWLPAKRATHIFPRIGGVPLLSVSAGHLNAFYADLLADGRRNGSGGLSPATVERIHATIHKALADAVRDWLATPLIGPPKESTAEMSVWTGSHRYDPVSLFQGDDRAHAPAVEGDSSRGSQR